VRRRKRNKIAQEKKNKKRRQMNEGLKARSILGIRKKKKQNSNDDRYAMPGGRVPAVYEGGA